MCVRLHFGTLSAIELIGEPLESAGHLADYRGFAWGPALTTPVLAVPVTTNKIHIADNTRGIKTESCIVAQIQATI